MNILVCGGAGYIGSHACRWLSQHGHAVTVLDNLSTGHAAAVQWGELLRADLREPAQVDAAFSGRGFDAVMHFAARSVVGESVRNPLEYYSNNVAGSLNLLQAMQVHGVCRLVFSSTAAVYGDPRDERIAEDHPLAPINPYGASKAMVERLIADSAAAWGLRAVALRYFNAAGATPSGGLGEKHTPETHLIPNVLQACDGSAATLQVFGDDWPTPDGTCVRDFVHVDDLAQAHALALAWMDSNAGFNAFNLGLGRGFSVREVIAAAESVVGRPVAFSVAPRRDGDPARLVASGELAKEVLGWAPRYVSLPEIVETAWNWHRSPTF